MAIFTPSITSFFKIALSASSLVLGSQPEKRAGRAELCQVSQLSCHNTTLIQNTCCFNAPGGLLLQTQFWDANPATGPVDSWTVHGLWPDNCDGTYDAFCDKSREYPNITQILESYGRTDLLSYMNTFWKDYQGNDESFWEHEWNKHGTCISTLEPSCYVNYTPQEEVVDYFQRTVQLFQTLPTYKILANASILPSATTSYTLSEIEAALSAYHGNQVTVGCANGALNEIWYYFNVRGSVQTGQFVSAPPDGSKSTCPDTGIHYSPKNYTTPRTSPTGTAAATTTSTAAVTATAAPFGGRGQLMVEVEGKQEGCIISGGTWYAAGTCATFTSAKTTGGFTLTSSKGLCAIANGALTCSSSVSQGTSFTEADGFLAVGGSVSFYAGEVPTAQIQSTIYTVQHAKKLWIRWQSL